MLAVSQIIRSTDTETPGWIFPDGVTVHLRAALHPYRSLDPKVLRELLSHIRHTACSRSICGLLYERRYDDPGEQEGGWQGRFVPLSLSFILVCSTRYKNPLPPQLAP